jgi:ParB family transcriptional regulator, chromosome partitioning protein
MVLGKGLGALIPSGAQSVEPVSIVPTPETIDDGASFDVLAHIEVSQIDPNPYQPRVDFDSESLRELAQSIRENGLVQPITVRRWDDRYQLISGERRVRACQQAGITHIPAYIRKVESAEEMLELALIENIQRATLNPVEIAQSYRQLVEDYGHSPEQVAQKVGKDRSTVVNFMRLLKLPKRILESLQKNEITMGHARALITLPDETAQLRTWQRVIRDGLSVRKVEELVKNIYSTQRPATAPKKTTTPSSVPGAFDDITRKLRPVFGTKVHIAATKEGKGSISFEFYSNDDLERIIELLLSVGSGERGAQ